MSTLAAVNVSVTFGSITGLDAVSVSIGSGDRIGVIAPNGVGKSTFAQGTGGRTRA